MSRPLPIIDDLSRPYWEGLAVADAFDAAFKLKEPFENGRGTIREHF